MTFQQIIWVWCLGTLISATYDNVISPMSTLDRIRSYADKDPKIAMDLDEVPVFWILFFVTSIHFFMWFTLPIRLFNEYQQYKGGK
jgi:hypothetical protein